MNVKHRWTIPRAAALLLLAVTCWGCGGPPQMGDDPKTFKTVDALYTAVSLRDPKLVDQCKTTLSVLRDDGKLGKDASEELDAIMTEATSGQWENAQLRLGHFMQGQRRGR